MGKVALVTGANRGLGLEVARSLAARGWTVAAGVRQASRLPPVPGVTAVVDDLRIAGLLPPGPAALTVEQAVGLMQAALTPAALAVGQPPVAV